ncbi:DUF1217 domain-containing protein [Fulvimarina endophytica]|nr:DUF1217 domain-containing protein [Fulvimarina endophytica]
MLSTLQTFQFYTRDTSRIMDQIKSDPMNKRDMEYYRENISKVKSVDEFMSDYRLYSYAMTAFGLAEQVESRGLIRKVLESDIDQPLSLVNKIGDDRYRELYKAFNFTGKTTEPAAQSASQIDRITEAYSEYRVVASNSARQKLDAYATGIASVKSVDEFLQSSAVFDVAMAAVGIDPAYASKSFIRDVFTSNVADEAAARGDNRFVELKAMFNFQPDGTAAPGGVQSKLEMNETMRRYYDEKNLLSSPASAMNDIEYWRMKMPSVRSVDQFVQDPRLLDVALRSVGLDAGIQSSEFVGNILRSDPDDPDSALNQMADTTETDRLIKSQYRELRALFDFRSDGSLAAGMASAIDPANETSMFDEYLKLNASRSASSDRVATSLYKIGVVNIETVSQFMRNKNVYDYALKAYGIDPATASRTEIMNVLRSDPGDPKSYAVKSGDPRFVALAAAFNFDESGKIADKRTAQNDKAFSDTIDRYAKSVAEEPSALQKQVIEKTTNAYREAIADVISVKDFVSSKVIVDYVTAAFDLKDLKLTPSKLSEVLTSDLDDPNSLINRMDDKRLRELRNAFQFNSFGGIDRADGGVQSKADRIMVEDFFLRQKYEEQAGAESEGARLALYFKRSAENIKTAFDVLAEPALLKVIQTAVGLPAESGQADLEAQARMIEKRVDFESFKDPEALSRFINRFVALWDSQNGGGAGGFDAAAIILGGGGGDGSLGIF